MDSNNQIEPCLSRKSSEGKPQIFTTLRNIDLTLLTILKLHMSIKESLMQRKCLICPPSAIYQPIQKLRVIFPDLLFIRKGQGVTPTAFAMYLYESITQGLESILGALDIEGSYDKQRTITIAPSPSVGALVLPVIYRAIKTHYPQLLLRNPPISGAENQLSQFQTDLIINNVQFLEVTRRAVHPVLNLNDKAEHHRNQQGRTVFQSAQLQQPDTSVVKPMLPVLRICTRSAATLSGPQFR